jgi:hypothetical protein
MISASTGMAGNVNAQQAVRGYADEVMYDAPTKH